MEPITPKFWDVSQLSKTELEVLEVAKGRKPVATIQKKDGNYIARHQKVIEQWQAEGYLEPKSLDLEQSIVPFDFTDITTDSSVNQHLPDYKIILIKERFDNYQCTTRFQMALHTTNPTLYKMLIEQGVFEEEESIHLSESTLVTMALLMKEIKKDSFNRTKRKGVGQYHQRCDFYFWLMNELGILEQVYSEVEQHYYYELQDHLFRAKKAALEAAAKPEQGLNPKPYIKITTELEVPKRIVVSELPNELEETPNQLPYTFQRYIGGSRPPTNTRLIVVADTGEFRAMTMFETYFNRDKFHIDPSVSLPSGDPVKVYFWLEISWGDSQVINAPFHPFYDAYVHIGLQENSFDKKLEGNKDITEVNFCPALSQEAMNYALSVYKREKQPSLTSTTSS